MPADGTNGPTGAVPAVSCRDIVVRYRDRTAVDRVSFSAASGEVLCILGPNGAGKTSTVECLEGYRRPALGAASVLGLDPWRDHAALVRRIGVMLQRGGLYPMLGARRALRLFASYYDDPVDPEELLDLMRLRDVARTPWRHLSGGEQARLSLALALVGRPDVVFLDEPTAGAVREVIAGLRDRGVCVVLTTHELTEAERLADRILILHHGVVAAEGTPASLAASAGRESALRDGAAESRHGTGGFGEDVSFGAAPGLDVVSLAATAGAPVVEGPSGRYRVTAPPGRSAAAVAAALTTWLADRGVALQDLRVGRSLEEAYLAVVGTADEGPETGTAVVHAPRRSARPRGGSRRAERGQDTHGNSEGRAR